MCKVEMRGRDAVESNSMIGLRHWSTRGNIIYSVTARRRLDHAMTICKVGVIFL